MRKNNFPSVLGILCFFFFVSSGYSQNIEFHGYGTVAAGTVIGNNDAPFVADTLSQGTYDDEVRFEPESMIALRATMGINDRVKGTLQLTGKGGDSSDAYFEWAYLTYKLNPDTDINAGRFRLPLFYYSNYLDAAYAYLWIRPPTDVYGIPASTITGANIINYHYFNELGVTTQIWYGDESSSQSDVSVDITRSQGINLMFDYKIFQLRGVYHTLRLGVDLEPFLVSTPGGLIQVDPEAVENDITYMALAFMVEFGKLTLRSEFTNVDAEGADEETDSAYGSIGYAIGDFTPHYTYSFSDGVEDSETHIVGVRWDFKPSTALKFEYTNRHYETDGGNTLVGPIAADEYRTELLSIALDFVF